MTLEEVVKQLEQLDDETLICVRERGQEAAMRGSHQAQMGVFPEM